MAAVKLPSVWLGLCAARLYQRALLLQRALQEANVDLPRRGARLQGQRGGGARRLTGGKTGRHDAQRAVRLVRGRDGAPGDEQVLDLQRDQAAVGG